MDREILIQIHRGIFFIFTNEDSTIFDTIVEAKVYCAESNKPSTTKQIQYDLISV